MPVLMRHRRQVPPLFLCVGSIGIPCEHGDGALAAERDLPVATFSAEAREVAAVADWVRRG
jgi:hypothetical protein